MHIKAVRVILGPNSIQRRSAQQLMDTTIQQTDIAITAARRVPVAITSIKSATRSLIHRTQHQRAGISVDTS